MAKVSTHCLGVWLHPGELSLTLPSMGSKSPAPASYTLGFDEITSSYRVQDPRTERNEEG